MRPLGEIGNRENPKRDKRDLYQRGKGGRRTKYKKVVRLTLGVIKCIRLMSNFSKGVWERQEARSSRLSTMFLRHAAWSFLACETIGKDLLTEETPTGQEGFMTEGERRTANKIQEGGAADT